jgi:hypothetical protein
MFHLEMVKQSYPQIFCKDVSIICAAYLAHSIVRVSNLGVLQKGPGGG